MRRILGNIVLALVVFALMFLLAEGTWRLTISSGDMQRQYDPLVGLVNPPHAEWMVRAPEFVTRMRTNALGFRGPELSPRGNPEELRILFLGDSFVEEKPVAEEDRFVERTAELLSGELGRPVTSRALAVGGANPARELLFYRVYGRAWDSDVVIQVLFLENDLFSRSGSYLFRRDSSGALELADIRPEPFLPCSLKCQLLRKSEVLLQIYRIVRGRGSGDGKPGLGDLAGYTIDGQKQYEEEGRFDVLRALVQALRQDVEKDGAIFFTVLMPAGFEIEDEWRKEIQEQYRDVMPDTGWRPSWLLDRGGNILESAGIRVLDLRPALVARAAQDQHLYLRINGHLNAAGSRAVAEEIIETIAKLLTGEKP
ncbi:MAG: hypothetical protein AAB489_03950 [Patescibacteria group bacterium]